jgi:protein-tyrosine phosphatase
MGSIADRDGIPPALNLRDLGGLDAGEGLRMRDGLLFRSGNPAVLGGGDLAALERLGVSTVLDLRTETERRRHPPQWPQSWAARTVSFETADSVGGRWIGDVIVDPTGEETRRFMREVYEEMALIMSPALVAAIEVILDPDGPPLLVHCTAGKDRTGVFLALLLTALDFPWDSVVADFARSDEFFGRTEIAAFVVASGLVAEADIAPISLDAARALPEYLEAALDAAAREEGSFAGYLRRAGLSEGDLEAARGRLVATPSPPQIVR